MSDPPRFLDHEGREMVPMRCDLCGEQIGLRSPGPVPELVVTRCYSCAVSEEIEAALNPEGEG